MTPTDPADIWSSFAAAGVLPDQRAAFRAACLEAIRQSGLFDPATYLATRGPLANGADPLADYHDSGWRAGHKPNPYFDPAWYRAEYADVAATDRDPLVHFISYGEAEGRRPVEWFDPAWYRAHHDVGAASHALRHFLLHRHNGSASPMAAFDSAWYLAQYPDVAAAGMDPMEHYLLQGFREDRNPSPAFDGRYYRAHYLGGRFDTNPLLHFLRHGAAAGLRARMAAAEPTIARDIRRFSAPGPMFEEIQPAPPDVQAQAMVLAFYLPQFHAIAENDSWWGKGFTEWSNLGRGCPRFAGHYQPRIPRDLGHYDLNNPETLRRQIALARGALLGGFVFYFYWFDGFRLLDRPLEQMLADPTLDFPFCLMWANENWTRQWDGSDDDVLIAQHYHEDDEPALLATYARHFADPRYIRLQGRPLLMIYRPALIPDAPATIARWRQRFQQQHGENPILIMAQSFADEDPARFGLDGATEFPPHKLLGTAARLDDRLHWLDHEFAGQVYDYGDLARRAAACQPAAFPLIRAAAPGWDNDARRQASGLVLHGATPLLYETWLARLIAQARARPFFGAPVVCINAWNEWAEGAYLEPDQHFGAAFLNASGRAIGGLSARPTRKLLLIGHDAFPAGAQLLLLHLARHWRAQGLDLAVLLGGGGSLLAEYQQVAATAVTHDAASLDRELGALRERGFADAIVNSAGSAWMVPNLRSFGVRIVLLVHELPGLLRERDLLRPLHAACQAAATIVYAAATVRDAVAPLLNNADPPAVLLPQACYRAPAFSAEQRQRLRGEWRLAEHQTLALGLGYADKRKGFDLFLQVFAHVHKMNPELRMAWAGDIDPTLRHELAEQIAAAKATGQFELLGWRDDIAALLSAADRLLLTSREDPYPSAVLEALSTGLGVIAFAGSGGAPELLAGRPHCDVVPMADAAGMAASLARQNVIDPDRAMRGKHFADQHGLADYAQALLALAWPNQPGISVIVPCFDQAQFLEWRLRSLFAQTQPIREIMLFDDGSSDDSIQRTAAIAQQAGRAVRVVAAKGSGSPFGCWPAAVGQAAGELVWIAEADDAAAPDCLARLAAAMAAPDMLFAFCDSRAVAADGTPAGASYRAEYARAAGAGALVHDETFAAADFAARFLSERNVVLNVSAVLWRRSALLAALDSLGDELRNWRVAGDWRLYWQVLTAATGRVAYVAAALNVHRRHGRSASARVPAGRHLQEIERMHALTRSAAGGDDLRRRQAAYLAAVAKELAQKGQADGPRAKAPQP